jgi:hypothetical protein
MAAKSFLQLVAKVDQVSCPHHRKGAACLLRGHAHSPACSPRQLLCVCSCMPSTTRPRLGPQDFFPEHLGCMFIINVPLMFRAVWAFVRQFLDERTLMKIQARALPAPPDRPTLSQPMSWLPAARCPLPVLHTHALQQWGMVDSTCTACITGLQPARHPPTCSTGAGHGLCSRAAEGHS